MESQHDRQVGEIVGEFRLCNIDNHEKSIETELKQLDVHFNWDLQKEKTNIDTSALQRKITTVLANSGFTFAVFSSQLVLAQELIKTDTSRGLQKIIECEQWVKNLKNDNCKEKEFIPIFEALQFIVMGCKAFALFKSGFITETKEILQNIPDCSRMDEKQISGIYGVKAFAFVDYAAFYMEDYSQGLCKAGRYIKIARSKFPEMAEWHYISGLCMTYYRAINCPFLSVSDKEKNFYRTAYELNENNMRYLYYLADTTSNSSRRMPRVILTNSKDIKMHIQNKMDEMNAEASSLFKKLIQLSLDQNDADILARSAFKLIKLPKLYRCVDLSVQAIERALVLCPDSPLINHYAGLIYSRYVKDFERGLKYLKLSAKMKNYYSLVDWIRLKFELNPESYDPVPELTEALEYKNYLSITFTLIASWYFLNKNDLFQGWQYLKKVSEQCHAWNHQHCFIRINDPIDLYEVMYDEVKLRIAKQKFENEEEKETLMSIGEELRKQCPEAHPFNYDNLKAQILDKSAEFMRRDSHNFNRYMQSSRGRGGRNFHRAGEYLPGECRRRYESFNQDRYNSSEGKATKSGSNSGKEGDSARNYGGRYDGEQNRTHYSRRNINSFDNSRRDDQRNNFTSSFRNKSKTEDWRSELLSREEAIELDKTQRTTTSSFQDKDRKQFGRSSSACEDGAGTR